MNSHIEKKLKLYGETSRFDYLLKDYAKIVEEFFNTKKKTIKTVTWNDYHTKFKAEDPNEQKLASLRFNAEEVAIDLIDILVSKHNDYGPGNIAKAPGGPLNGLAVRLHDKVERLSNLVTNSKTPNHESLEDTFIDIANYAIIALLVLDNKWK